MAPIGFGIGISIAVGFLVFSFFGWTTAYFASFGCLAFFVILFGPVLLICHTHGLWPFEDGNSKLLIFESFPYKQKDERNILDKIRRRATELEQDKLTIESCREALPQNASEMRPQNIQSFNKTLASLKTSLNIEYDELGNDPNTLTAYKSGLNNILDNAYPVICNKAHEKLSDELDAFNDPPSKLKASIEALKDTEKTNFDQRLEALFNTIERKKDALDGSLLRWNHSLITRAVGRIKVRCWLHTALASLSIGAAIVFLLLSLTSIYSMAKPPKPIVDDFRWLLNAAPKEGQGNVSTDDSPDGKQPVTLTSNKLTKEPEEWTIEKKGAKFLVRKTNGEPKERSTLKEAIQYALIRGDRPLKISLKKAKTTSSKTDRASGAKTTVSGKLNLDDEWSFKVDSSSDTKASEFDPFPDGNELLTELETRYPPEKYSDTYVLKVGESEKYVNERKINTSLILNPLSRIGASIISVLVAYFCVQLAIYHSRLTTFYYGRREAMMLSGHHLFGPAPADRWEFGELAATLSAHDIEHGQMPEFQAVASSLHGLSPQSTIQNLNKDGKS